jgi:hypothetical protein
VGPVVAPDLAVRAGLQIESIWATAPMAVRAFRPGDYLVGVSRWQAFESPVRGASVM